MVLLFIPFMIVKMMTHLFGLETRFYIRTFCPELTGNKPRFFDDYLYAFKPLPNKPGQSGLIRDKMKEKRVLILYSIRVLILLLFFSMVSIVLYFFSPYNITAFDYVVDKNISFENSINNSGNNDSSSRIIFQYTELSVITNYILKQVYGKKLRNCLVFETDKTDPYCYVQKASISNPVLSPKGYNGKTRVVTTPFIGSSTSRKHSYSSHFIDSHSNILFPSIIISKSYFEYENEIEQEEEEEEEEDNDNKNNHNFCSGDGGDGNDGGGRGCGGDEDHDSILYRDFQYIGKKKLINETSLKNLLDDLYENGDTCICSSFLGFIDEIYFLKYNNHFTNESNWIIMHNASIIYNETKSETIYTDIVYPTKSLLSRYNDNDENFKLNFNKNEMMYYSSFFISFTSLLYTVNYDKDETSGKPEKFTGKLNVLEKGFRENFKQNVRYNSRPGNNTNDNKDFYKKDSIRIIYSLDKHLDTETTRLSISGDDAKCFIFCKLKNSKHRGGGSGSGRG